MRMSRLVLLCGAALCVGAGFAGQGVAATAEEAKALVERAVVHIKEVGEEQAFKDFMKPDGGFIAGELYVFCYDENVTLVALGSNPAMVGKNLRDLKDPDGKLASAEIVKMGMEHGAGWVDYKWPNPVSKRIETKSTYVVKVNDKVCGTGYYKG